MLSTIPSVSSIHPNSANKSIRKSAPKRPARTGTTFSAKKTPLRARNGPTTIKMIPRTQGEPFKKAANPEEEYKASAHPAVLAQSDAC